MQTIYLTATFDIPAEYRERFRELSTQLIESVREKEPDTLQYQWFYNADGSRCRVLEVYRDVAAVKAHADNVGPVLGELVASTKITLEFYGAPTEEMRGIVEFLNAELYEHAGGVDRLIPA